MSAPSYCGPACGLEAVGCVVVSGIAVLRWTCWAEIAIDRALALHQTSGPCLLPSGWCWRMQGLAATCCLTKGVWVS
jgi:hypothetical protein